MPEFALEEQQCMGPLPSTTRGRGFHLGITSKGKDGPRLAYGCQGNVVIRNLEDTNKTMLFQEHQGDVKVAKFDCRGGWVFSGDATGTALVWSSSHMTIKQEVKCGKCILDIDSDGKSERLVFCGEGKEERVKMTPWNSSNKLGDLSGSSGTLLSCAFKPTRPFHVVVAAEDPVIVFSSKGPPFKFQCSQKDHNKYINCVRFHPSGNFFVTCGSDKKMFVYDGKDGSKVREIKDGKKGHKGSIYALCFNDDGSKFITVSADKTAKIWDFESGKCEQTISVADKPTLLDMQVACGWAGKHIVSVSLSGQINFLAADKDVPIRKLAGHKKPISVLDVDEKEETVYSACTLGYVVATNYKTGENAFFEGAGHKGLAVYHMALNCDRSKIISIGSDGTLLYSPVAERKFAEKGFKLDGAPRCLATANLDASLAIVGTHKGLLFVLRDGQVAEKIDLPSEPLAIDVAPDDSEFCVALKDKSLIFFNWKGEKVETLKHDLMRAEVTTVRYSPCGKRVLTADAQRYVWNWDRSNLENPLNRKSSWRFHSSAVKDTAWAADSKTAYTVGTDGAVFVWQQALEGGQQHFEKKFAHVGGTTCVVPVEGLLITAGYDGSIKTWKVVEQVEEKSNIF